MFRFTVFTIGLAWQDVSAMNRYNKELSLEISESSGMSTPLKKVNNQEAALTILQIVA